VAISFLRFVGQREDARRERAAELRDALEIGGDLTHQVLVDEERHALLRERHGPGDVAIPDGRISRSHEAARRLEGVPHRTHDPASPVITEPLVGIDVKIRALTERDGRGELGGEGLVREREQIDRLTLPARDDLLERLLLVAPVRVPEPDRRGERSPGEREDEENEEQERRDRPGLRPHFNLISTLIPAATIGCPICSQW
jgi:hypothetical protein